MSFFFFNDTATTEIYTLSLHDALPIYRSQPLIHGDARMRVPPVGCPARGHQQQLRKPPSFAGLESRSEEHTSELQSHLNLVCRLLLEKKKKSEKLVREIITQHTADTAH